MAHLPALIFKQRMNTAVSVPTVLTGQANDGAREDRLVRPWLRFIANRGSGDAQRTADTSLRVTVLLFDMLDGLSPSRRAQYFPSVTSLRISLSTVRSATARFSRAFSTSSSFSRLA